ncbi:Tim17/Tim22/Tim23/Pmp24 family [Phytophthora infestans]|nr:Tim17/Tim22/Tim23/Pmp24 family [Phytophthora infestans]KAF4143722.1 Tim17/Tim22/Tim23/Pmp24 family [Phytophthora infestans]
MARRRSAGIMVGSASALVPLLTVAGVSAIADRREALNASNTSKTSNSECVTNTALLTLRGLGTGAAWTIAVDGYAMACVTDAEVARHMANRPGSSVAGEIARKLGPLCVRNMLGFAGFLGLYGGVSCSLEKARDKNDLLNPFMGGLTAGLIALWHDRRVPHVHLTSAAACGALAMVLHRFNSPITKESENVCATTTDAP